MDGWTILIAAHATCASLALVVGAVLLLRRKGDGRHVLTGRVWLGLMNAVVLSSFGITRLHPGHFSWIHLLAIWTFISLTMGLVAIRRGRVLEHRGWMVGSYLGLLGAFAGVVAVPVRLVPQTAVHHPVPLALVTGVIVLAGLALAQISARAGARRVSVRPTPVSTNG